MPGPCNHKKRTKFQSKKQKKSKSRTSLESHAHSSFSLSPSPSPLPSPSPSPPPYAPATYIPVHAPYTDADDSYDGIIPKPPCITNPGNGIRVRDTRAFLSSFFAQRPSLDDPLCAEFAQEEVLQMLCAVLPEETALILWYNKSRTTGRICPACQRLYRLGDVLPDLMDDEDDRDRVRPPQLEREQELSGLCSPVCFILASWAYPGAIKSSWGRTADEMDDATWALLNGPGEYPQGSGGQDRIGLGMMLKMTRLGDLGLGQLLGIEEGEEKK